MPPESFSTTPVSTCSSTCDGRYGAHQQELTSRTLHYRLFYFFSIELVEWPWGGHENKDDRIIPAMLWKDYPLATALAKTRVNILKCKWHSHSAEWKPEGALCWNQRRRLDWGFFGRKTWPTHLHWRQLAGLEIAKCNVEAGNWLHASGKFYCGTLLCLSKYSKMKQCWLNPATGMHIWEWQRYGSYIHCIIYEYISFVALRAGC